MMLKINASNGILLNLQMKLYILLLMILQSRLQSARMSRGEAETGRLKGRLEAQLDRWAGRPNSTTFNWAWRDRKRVTSKVDHRLLHPQHLDGIWIGQDQYRLPLAPLNEFPEPWC